MKTSGNNPVGVQTNAHTERIAKPIFSGSRGCHFCSALQ
jgi:hypothetical protein